jgi:hypothetical protein
LEPQTSVLSTGAERKGYQSAAAMSEVVLGEKSDDQRVTSHPSSRSLIPEDKPLTPAPTIRQCPLAINPHQTLVYYEFVQSNICEDFVSHLFMFFSYSRTFDNISSIK